MNFVGSIQRAVVFGAPLTLGILEIWHPVGSSDLSAFESIAEQVDWWIGLHLLQLPLFGLVALVILMLTCNIQSRSAVISRVGIALFIIFYTALDSIMGIAGGFLIRDAQNFSPAVQEFVAHQINFLLTNPIIGGATYSLIGVLGAGGWFIGTSFAAISLLENGLPRLSFIFLILSGVLFGISHVPPTGPLGMFCLFIALIIAEVSGRSFPIKEL